MAAFPTLLASLFASVVLLCLTIPHAAGAYYEISEYAEVFSAQGPRQSEFPTKLGQVFSYNNDLRVGDAKGATVGFTNGNCLVSAEVSAGVPNTYYECYETLVFTGGPYQGSSLTIVGFYDFVANGPLAIVGGTGTFRGATGELNYLYPPTSDFTYSNPSLVFITPDFGTPPPPAPTTQAPSPTSTPTPSSTLTPSPTVAPTPSSAPPTTCNPGSDKPNQCFNANGSSFVCCAGGCGPSGATATCA